MSHRPTKEDIERQDRYLIKRQQDFRHAADTVTQAFVERPEVTKVVLFGSVARPLWREVPRFSPYRRYRIEVLHKCKDVDLAVWLSTTDQLFELNRARNRALSPLYKEMGIGVAQHQVDVFLFAPADDRYLGRLCCFSSCPKGKIDCLTPGCGDTPHLKQHEDFTLTPDALADDRTFGLFDRQTGIRQKAVDLPQLAL